jgi:hypothetical protein
VIAKRVPGEKWTGPAADLARMNHDHVSVADAFARLFADPDIAATLDDIDCLIVEKTGWRRSLLWCIGSGGGWQPEETEGKWEERRRKIARKARELAKLMADDPGCGGFTLEELWSLGVGVDPTELAFERRKHSSKMPRFAAGSDDDGRSVKAPIVGHSLVAMAAAIDRDLV